MTFSTALRGRPMAASSRRARLLFDVIPNSVQQTRSTASHRVTAETKPGSRPANHYMYTRALPRAVCAKTSARPGAEQNNERMSPCSSSNNKPLRTIMRSSGDGGFSEQARGKTRELHKRRTIKKPHNTTHTHNETCNARVGHVTFFPTRVLDCSCNPKQKTTSPRAV